MNSLKPKRNSLIELYRFLFAIWVVYYHGYFFLPKSQLFSSGYLSVDFFFMLTGFFVMKDILQQEEFSFGKGMINLAYKKVKPLGWTLIISLVFAFTYFFMNLDEPGDPMGYMWFIEWLVIVPIIYYAIYRLVNNEKTFYIITACVIIISYVLLYTICIEWGMFRGLSCIGIGILISLIPKNGFKIKKFNLNILIVSFLIILTIVAACFNYKWENHDHLFILFLFPFLLYFSSCIAIDCPVLNYLGGLSFGLYAYQTICRVLEHVGVLNDKDNCIELFCIVVGCTLLDDLIKKIVRAKNSKKLAKKN